MNILDKIMKPRSIAVVGASTKQHTIGSDIMKRLREYGYAGPVYPVNPKGGVIEGLPAYEQYGQQGSDCRFFPPMRRCSTFPAKWTLPSSS